MMPPRDPNDDDDGTKKTKRSEDRRCENRLVRQRARTNTRRTRPIKTRHKKYRSEDRRLERRPITAPCSFRTLRTVLRLEPALPVASQNLNPTEGKPWRLLSMSGNHQESLEWMKFGSDKVPPRLIPGVRIASSLSSGAPISKTGKRWLSREMPPKNRDRTESPRFLQSGDVVAVQGTNTPKRACDRAGACEHPPFCDPGAAFRRAGTLNRKAKSHESTCNPCKEKL